MNNTTKEKQATSKTLRKTLYRWGFFVHSHPSLVVFLPLLFLYYLPMQKWAKI